MTTTIYPVKENLLNFTEEELKGKTFYFYTVLSVRISTIGYGDISVNAKRLDMNASPLDAWFVYRIDGISKSELDKLVQNPQVKKFLDENAEVKDSEWYEGMFRIDVKKNNKIETIRSSLHTFASEDPLVKKIYEAIDIAY